MVREERECGVYGLSLIASSVPSALFYLLIPVRAGFEYRFIAFSRQSLAKSAPTITVN
ncbi:hypothetical protein [Chroococcidiopsis sp.]|uniref:hypothetical protein n=1 Tax=Chroococcidiopsis sp. TaxID=3088168 RepID=UPI003F2D194E